MEDKIAYLGLGTNRGDRKENLVKAVETIAKTIGKIISESAVYLTEPWGFTDDQYFLNQVIGVITHLSPSGVLQKIKIIETELGRNRSGKRYEPRTLDIDILFYNDQIIDHKDLKIPHPALQDRKFVLVPLAEIAGGYIHPVFHKSVSILLSECKDQKKVHVLIS